MTSVFKNIKALESPRPPTITFQLAPTHVAYANTLRRLCMTSVKVVGFNADIGDDGSTTDVKIYANSTPMTNEMLAHRIGLLSINEETPLDWDPEKYEFSLHVTNESNTTLDVTASDITVMEKRGEDLVPIPSERFFKPNPVTRKTALIAVLKPLMLGGVPEEVRFSAKATVGIGRKNARFIPTTQCSYSYTKDEDPQHREEAFNNWLNLSKKITDPVGLKEKEPEKRKSFWKEFETLEIGRCYLKNALGEPESFDFTIESAGVLHPGYIIEQACENGAIMCKQYAGETLPDSVTVDPVDGHLRGWDFIFQHEDHTLGNCIQSWLDENRVGKGDITFAGYDVPHPLRDEMVIRIGCADGSEATARIALREAMVACANMFSVWKQQWEGIYRKTASVTPATLKKTTRTIARPKQKTAV